jgi:hypothetical protein
VPRAAPTGTPAAFQPPNETRGSDADAFLAELQQSLGDMLLTGLARDASHSRAVAERTEQSRRLGFVQVTDALARLAGDLAGRSDMLQWDPFSAVAHLQHLCVVSRIAAEESGR